MIKQDDDGSLLIHVQRNIIDSEENNSKREFNKDGYIISRLEKSKFDNSPFANRNKDQLICVDCVFLYVSEDSHRILSKGYTLKNVENEYHIRLIPNDPDEALQLRLAF